MRTTLLLACVMLVCSVSPGYAKPRHKPLPCQAPAVTINDDYYPGNEPSPTPAPAPPTPAVWHCPPSTPVMPVWPQTWPVTVQHAAPTTTYYMPTRQTFFQTGSSSPVMSYPSGVYTQPAVRYSTPARSTFFRGGNAGRGRT
jgi:hypothetical protein